MLTQIGIHLFTFVSITRLSLCDYENVRLKMGEGQCLNCLFKQGSSLCIFYRQRKSVLFRLANIVLEFCCSVIDIVVLAKTVIITRLCGQ